MYYSRWDWSLSVGIKRFFYCKHATQLDDKWPDKNRNKNFKRLDDSIVTNAASQVKMTDTVIYVFSCYISLNKN